MLILIAYNPMNLVISLAIIKIYGFSYTRNSFSIKTKTTWTVISNVTRVSKHLHTMKIVYLSNILELRLKFAISNHL